MSHSEFSDYRVRMKAGAFLFSLPEWGLIPAIFHEKEQEAIATLRRETCPRAIALIQAIEEIRDAVRDTALEAGVTADPFLPSTRRGV